MQYLIRLVCKVFTQYCAVLALVITALVCIAIYAQYIGERSEDVEASTRSTGLAYVQVSCAVLRTELSHDTQ